MTDIDTSTAAPTPSWVRELRAALASLPAGYEQSAEVLLQLHTTFHQELARAVEPRINSAMNSTPHVTLEECRVAAAWCNRELHALGLAARPPGADVPCALIVSYKTGDPQRIPRFTFQLKDKSGTQRMKFGRDLPWIAVTKARPSRVGFASNERER